MSDPTTLSYSIGAGEMTLPGHPVYIADHGGGVPDFNHKALLSQLSVYGSAPPAFPATPQTSTGWSLADGVIRYQVVGDPSFNTLALDLTSGSGMAANIEAHSALFANVTDLSDFMDNGENS
jgi:feruloyl esterase